MLRSSVLFSPCVLEGHVSRAFHSDTMKAWRWGLCFLKSGIHGHRLGGRRWGLNNFLRCDVIFLFDFVFNKLTGQILRTKKIRDLYAKKSLNSKFLPKYSSFCCFNWFREDGWVRKIKAEDDRWEWLIGNLLALTLVISEHRFVG